MGGVRGAVTRGSPPLFLASRSVPLLFLLTLHVAESRRRSRVVSVGARWWVKSSWMPSSRAQMREDSLVPTSKRCAAGAMLSPPWALREYCLAKTIVFLFSWVLGLECWVLGRGRGRAWSSE